MKRIIIIVAVLAILGGGGFYAYTNLLNKDGAEEVAAVEEEKDKKPTELTYVDMEPFVLSVIGKDRAHHVLSMAVALEVSDITQVDTVKALKPRLTDAFLTEMYSIVERRSIREGGPLPFDEIRSRLMKVSQRIAGKDVVNGVLLQILNRHPV